MADIKVYEMRKDVVIAYQVDGKGTNPITMGLNESGWYDQAYHGSVITQAIGGVRPGDYVVYDRNGLWKAVKKEEFEALYQPTEDKAVKYDRGSYIVVFEDPAKVKPVVVDEPAVADVNTVVEEVPAVLVKEEQFKVEEEPVKVEEAPKKKKKSVRDL